MTKSATLAFILIAAMSTAAAQAADKAEKVKFKADSSSAIIKGVVTGYDTHRYVLGAAAGQVMSVLLKTSNKSCYFNVLEPGNDYAVHRGDSDGDEFSANLTKTGDYLIEAFLMRNAARRGKTCKFEFTFEVTGTPSSVASSADGAEDAKVAGTNFNATGEIPCAREQGQPMQSCKYGVEREGNGKGAVTVFWPDEGSRVIFIDKGKPAFYNESEADAGAKMTVKQDEDLFSITIGKQRFEIPQAVISGG